MRVDETALPGVLLVHSRVYPDPRGFFTELYRADHYEALGIGPFVQDNHSRSLRGVLRGLHWQRHHAQGKLVTLARGAVFDVIVDVRPGSPTFARHVALELHEGTGAAVWVPAGYAHGFCVLSDVADVIYKCTDVYHPESARGLRWDDPALVLPWPVRDPVLSEADALLPTLDTIDPDELPPWW